MTKPAHAPHHHDGLVQTRGWGLSREPRRPPFSLPRWRQPARGGADSREARAGVGGESPWSPARSGAHRYEARRLSPHPRSGFARVDPSPHPLTRAGEGGTAASSERNVDGSDPETRAAATRSRVGQGAAIGFPRRNVTASAVPTPVGFRRLGPPLRRGGRLHRGHRGPHATALPTVRRGSDQSGPRASLRRSGLRRSRRRRCRRPRPGWCIPT
jgi:hypothetical protein